MSTVAEIGTVGIDPETGLIGTGIGGIARHCYSLWGNRVIEVIEVLNRAGIGMVYLMKETLNVEE